MGYYTPEDIERQAEEINKSYNYDDSYIKSLCYIYEQFNWTPYEMEEYHQPYSQKWFPEWLADYEIYDRQSEEQWKSMIDDYFDIYTKNSRRKRIWANLLGSNPFEIQGPGFVFRFITDSGTGPNTDPSNAGVPSSYLIADGELTVIVDGERFSDKYGNIWRFLPAGSQTGPVPFTLPDGTIINQDPMPGPDGGPTMVYDNSNDPSISIEWRTPPDFSNRIYVRYIFPDP